MPFIKKLSRVGNSSAVLLDKSILAQVDLAPNANVEISVHEKTIVIRPHRSARADSTRGTGEDLTDKGDKGVNA